MNKTEMYMEMQKSCGIERGDLVRVLRIARDNEQGWGVGWGVEMNDAVGKIFKVRKIHEIDGFQLEINGDNYWFPWFVLELVEKGSPLPKGIKEAFDKCDFGCQKDNILELVEQIVEYAREVEK